MCVIPQSIRVSVRSLVWAISFIFLQTDWKFLPIIWSACGFGILNRLFWRSYGPCWPRLVTVSLSKSLFWLEIIQDVLPWYEDAHAYFWEKFGLLFSIAISLINHSPLLYLVFSRPLNCLTERTDFLMCPFSWCDNEFDYDEIML